MKAIKQEYAFSDIDRQAFDDFSKSRDIFKHTNIEDIEDIESYINQLQNLSEEEKKIRFDNHIKAQKEQEEERNAIIEKYYSGYKAIVPTTDLDIKHGKEDAIYFFKSTFSNFKSLCIKIDTILGERSRKFFSTYTLKNGLLYGESTIGVVLMEKTILKRSECVDISELFFETLQQIIEIKEQSPKYEQEQAVNLFIDEVKRDKNLCFGKLKTEQSIRKAFDKSKKATVEWLDDYRKKKALYSNSNIAIFNRSFIDAHRELESLKYPNGSVSTQDKEKRRYNKLTEEFQRLALEKEIQGFEKLILLTIANGIYQILTNEPNPIFRYNENAELECEAIQFLEAIGKNTDKDTMQKVKETIEGMRQKGVVLTVKDEETGREREIFANIFSFEEDRRGRKLPVLWKFTELSKKIFTMDFEKNKYYLSLKPLLHIVHNTQAGIRQNALIDFVFHFMVEIRYSGCNKITDRKTMEDCSLLNYGSRAKREFEENKKMIEEALSDYVIDLTEKGFSGRLICVPK